jgi:uncharacterized membrane protein YkvA (DUF1232 family)
MAKALRGSWRRWFERKKRKAARLSEQPERALRLVGAAMAKRPPSYGKLRQTWADLQVLVRLVRAWARGEYRQVSRTTLVLVLGAIVYFVSPIDAILDTIPVLGYIDDAAVIAWVLSEVRAELESFRRWEAQAQLPAVALETETG